MKTAIKIFILVIFVGAIALLSAPFFMDWNHYKKPIQNQFQKMTGLKLAVEGDLHFQILPFPGMSVTGVNISNPENEADIADIARLDLSMAYQPLLKGQIVFDQLTLVGPDIRITENKQGRANWHTKELETLLQKEPADIETKTQLLPVQIRTIRIEKGSFSSQKEGGGLAAKSLHATLRSESVQGPFRLQGHSRIQGHNLNFDFKTEKITQGLENVSLQAALTLPDTATKIDYSGILTISDPFSMQGELNLRLDEPGQYFNLNDQNEIDATLSRPLSMAGLVSYDAGTLDLNNIQVLQGESVLGSGSIQCQDCGNQTRAIKGNVKLQDNAFLDAFMTGSNKMENETGNNKDFSVVKFVESVQKNFYPFDLPKKTSFAVNVKSDSLTPGDYRLTELTANISKKQDNIEFKGIINTIDTLDSDLQIRDFEVSGRIQYETSVSSLGDAFERYVDPDVVLQWQGEATGIVNILPFETAQLQDDIFAQLDNVSAKGAVSLSANNSEISIGFENPQSARVDIKAIMTSGEEDGRDLVQVNATGKKITLPPALFEKSRENGQGRPAFAGDGKAFSSLIAAYQQFAANMDLSVDLKFTNIKAGDLGEMKDIVLDAYLNKNQVQIERLYFAARDNSELLVEGALGIEGESPFINIGANLTSSEFRKYIPKQFINNDSSYEKLNQINASVKINGGINNVAMDVDARFLDVQLLASLSDLDIFNVSAIGPSEVQLVSSDLSAIQSVFAPELAKALNLQGKTDFYVAFQKDDERIIFNDFQGTVIGSALQGSGTINLMENIPSFDLKARLGRVDAAGLLPGKSRSDKARSNTPANQSNATDDDPKWSRNAIELEFLRTFNADIELAVKELVTHQADMRNVVVIGDLNAGTLSLESFSADVYGGEVVLSGRLRASDDARKPLRINGQFSLKDLQAGRALSKAAALPARVIEGPVSLNGEFSTFGLSPAALVYGLSGKGTISGRDLTVYGIDIDQLAQDLGQSTNAKKVIGSLQNSLRSGQTVFTEMAGTYVIKEGVVDVRELIMTGQNTAIESQGEVDLPLWKMDIESAMSVTADPDVPVIKARFAGPIDNPQKTFLTNTIEAFIRSKIQSKLQNILEDKLNLKSPDQTSSEPDQPTRQEAPDAVQDQTQEKAPQASPEEKIMRGIMDEILR